MDDGIGYMSVSTNCLLSTVLSESMDEFDDLLDSVVTG